MNHYENTGLSKEQIMHVKDCVAIAAERVRQLRELARPHVEIQRREDAEDLMIALDRLTNKKQSN